MNKLIVELATIPQGDVSCGIIPAWDDYLLSCQISRLYHHITHS